MSRRRPPSASPEPSSDEPFQTREHLRAVASAEQIEVIQQVVEVVKSRAPLAPRGRGPRLVVRAVERVAEAAEQAGHREIGFPITVIDRRIVNKGRAVRVCAPVAAPKIAVQQARRRRVAREECVEPIEQRAAERENVGADAVRACKLELMTEPAFAEELDPVLAPAVRLRRAADVVVAMPAESIAGRSMKPSERRAEPTLRLARFLREVDPLDDEKRVGAGNAVREDLGKRDR